jgi:hypothetical protein
MKHLTVLFVLLFFLIPLARAQKITVGTPVQARNYFDPKLPLQTWECSSSQLGLSNQLEFLDVNGSVTSYVDCHGAIHGGGTGGTVVSVDLIQGTGISLTGTCNSTTAISCTVAATGGGGSPGAPDDSVQYRIDASTFGGIPGSVVDPTTGEVDFASTVSTADLEGLTSTATVTGASARSHAMDATVQTSGTATPTVLEGVGAGCINAGSGSMGGCDDFHARTITNTGGGAINTAWGLYVEDQSAATTNWAIQTNAGKVEFGDIVTAGTLTLADGTAETAIAGEGYFFNCADCDTPVSQGATCTASGDHAGAWALFIEGAVACFGANISSGASPGGTPTQLQYNLGGVFAGVPGSSIDSSGDVTITPIASTSVALNVIAESNQDSTDLASSGNEPNATLYVDSDATDNPGTDSTGAYISSEVDSANDTAIIITTEPEGNFQGLTSYGLVANVRDEWSTGNPLEISQVLISLNGSLYNQQPNVSTGLHIEDQDMNGAGSTIVNAAILLESQTPGQNVYALKSSSGAFSVGDIFSAGILTLAQGTSETGAYGGDGWQFECSDCDTPTSQGATCTASGDHSGAHAIVIEGVIACFGANIASSPTSIFQGTATMPTGSPLTQGTQSSTVSVAVTGVVPNQCVGGFSADPTSSVGFTASTNGGLTVFGWPSAGFCNFAYQNNTANPITPDPQVLHFLAF